MSRPISVGCKSPKDQTPLCYDVNVITQPRVNLNLGYSHFKAVVLCVDVAELAFDECTPEALK